MGGATTMAMRKVVVIDEAKCDGCGDCVTSCAEGAIAVIDGKARLVSEIYCDGLGACLGHCPQGAITIEEREAAAFDEAATQKHLENLRHAQAATTLRVSETPHQCPGSMMRSFGRPAATVSTAHAPMGTMPSELQNWPIQLTLVPPMAPYLQGADILLVADCVPFAYADFHRRFLKDKPVIIGCPKLDQMDAYAKKLTEIVRVAKPKSLSVLHMEVPCCSGFTRLAQYALQAAASDIPLIDVTIGIRGEVLDTVELQSSHAAHR
jgi:Pyruvate/2-oxoacid:ferredoxin oxidoreductase delta subunit